MFRMIFRVLMLVLVAAVGYSAYQSYENGYFSMPDMPDGAYAFSTRNGMRGIVLDAKVSQPIEDMPKFFRRLNLANPERHYFTLPAKISPWFEKSWSTCTLAEDGAQEELEASMSEEVRSSVENARLDAVCVIDADGKKLLRGLLYSVPNL
jgi:hypothetical protein